MQTDHQPNLASATQWFHPTALVQLALATPAAVVSNAANHKRQQSASNDARLQTLGLDSHGISVNLAVQE